MAKLTICELDEHLKDLVDWKQFAHHLPGLEAVHISAIESQSNLVNAKLALYQKWLRVCPSASWRDVIQALEEVDENTIARNIRDKFHMIQPAMLTAMMRVPGQPAMPTATIHVPGQQPARIQVPEDVADELQKLHAEFLLLCEEVESEIKRKPDSLNHFVCHVKREKAFSIDIPKNPTTQQFLDAIRPHYTFLDYYLIVSLASLLSTSIASKASDYSVKTLTYLKQSKIAELRHQLDFFFQNSQSDSKMKVTIAVQNAWGTQKKWLIKHLVCQIFSLEHPDECQWFRVITGSTIFIFLADKKMASTLIKNSMQKIEFMKLTGVFRLTIGDKEILNDKENTAFSFENSLAQAKIENTEAVQFLSHVTFENPQMVQTAMPSPKLKRKTNVDETESKSEISSVQAEGSITQTKAHDQQASKLPASVPEDKVECELRELHDDFIKLETVVKKSITKEVEVNKTPLREFVEHTDLQCVYDIEIQSVKTSNDFFASIEPHYTFLDCYLIITLAQLLSDRPLAHRAKKYHDQVMHFMQNTRAINLVGKLEPYFQYFQSLKVKVTVRFSRRYSIWSIKTIIQQYFSLKHPDEMQWYRVYHGSVVVVLLIPRHKLENFLHIVQEDEDNGRFDRSDQFDHRSGLTVTITA